MSGKITENELSTELLSQINGTIAILSGTGNFNSTTGTVVTHSIGHTSYKVMITPSENPGGYLGEVWVEYTATSFTVFNSGSAITGFKYIVVE